METKVIIDDKKLNKSLDEQMVRLKNLKPIMKLIAQDMDTRKDINFRNQSDPEGNKWALLSVDSTLKFDYRTGEYKRKGNKILQDTGRLRASFKTAYDDKSAKIGTNTKYAATHQFGAKKGQYRVRLQGSSLRTGRRWAITIPWGDIPARPMIGITGKMRKKYNKMVLNYILGR